MNPELYRETSLLGILGRVFWMMVGPILLLVLAYNVVTTGNGWLTRADIAYLAVLGLLILVRGLEFRGTHPQKATGEPATLQDLRRYVTGAVLVGVGVWVAANLIGNGWLSR